MFNTVMEKIRAEDTLIWNRPEKNAIYLLSEFIDNSKSSYEEMIKQGVTHFMPILLKFDKKNEYISIQDRALGFDIKNSIEKIGRDEIQVGKTNQYFIGMKSAMNFFGDFTILISERIIDGEHRKFANIFVYKNGILPNDIELESTSKTGSEIFMFSRYAKANEFWRNLNFLDQSQKDAFPNESDLLTDNFMPYSNTHYFLDNLRKIFPIISESIFQRYTPLVNQFPNIEIDFQCFDSVGNDLLLDNTNRLKTEKGDLMPDFFKKVHQNDWESSVSFSFDNFFADDKNKFFKESLNKETELAKPKDFKQSLEQLLLDEVRQHFKKLKPAIGDELEKNSLGEYQPNFEWINYPENAKKIFLSEYDDSWSNYPFTEDLMKIFLAGFYHGTGKLAKISFKISNLIIDESRKIIVSRNGEDEDTFDIIFDFNIFSTNYSSKKEAEKLVTINQELITGMTLVQNNRAIYHGPNFNQNKQVGLSNSMPEKLLVRAFSEGQFSVFPNYAKKNEATFVKVGGNVARWSARLFGNIYVPNNSYFTSGTNKAQTTNLNILEEYVLKIIRDSGINVLIRWVYLMDNGAFFGKPTQNEIETFNHLTPKDLEKFEKGKILTQILANLYTSSLRGLPAISQKTGELNYEILKENLPDKIIRQLEKVFQGSTPAGTEESYNANTEAIISIEPVLENKDEDAIMKFALNFFKNIKRSNFNPLKLKKIDSLENGKKIVLEFGGRTFIRWKNTFALHFDTKRLPESIVKYIVEDGEPIQVKIPFDVNKWNIKDLEIEITDELIKIYRCLVNLQGFYKVANSKAAKKVNLNAIENTIEAFLVNELDKLNLQGK